MGIKGETFAILAGAALVATACQPAVSEIPRIEPTNEPNVLAIDPSQFSFMQEAAYYASLRPDMFLLNECANFSVDPSEIGAGAEHPTAIKEGATLNLKTTDGSTVPLKISYDHNGFSDQTVTYLHQYDRGNGPYLVGQHLNLFCYETMEKDVNVKAQQYFFFRSGEQEELDIVLEKGHSYGLIPAVSATPGMTVGLQYYKLPDKDDVATANGQPIAGAKIPDLPILPNRTGSTIGGTMFLLGEVVTDEATGEQRFNILGVISSNNVATLATLEEVKHPFYFPDSTSAQNSNQQ